MDRHDVRYSDDFGAPHPGRMTEDLRLRALIRETRAAMPQASAAEVRQRVEADLRRRGLAVPAGLDRLVTFMLR